MIRIDENVVIIDGNFEWCPRPTKKFLLQENDMLLYDFWSCPSVVESFSHPSKEEPDNYKVVVVKNPELYEITIRRKDEAETKA